MTSHTDNPYRKYWLESFQPPLSPHITFTSLTIFFHLSLLCSHFLLPYLKSPCLSPAIASLHHPFQWLMFPLHLSSVAPFIISTNECIFFFHFPWLSVSFHCNVKGYYLCITEELSKTTVSVPFPHLFLSIICPSQICSVIQFALTYFCVFTFFYAHAQAGLYFVL